MIFDIVELQIYVDLQVVFVYYFCYCGGIGLDGQLYFLWMWVSVGYCKYGDGWKVIYEYFLVLFDMDGKVLFDLQF